MQFGLDVYEVYIPHTHPRKKMAQPSRLALAKNEIFSFLSDASRSVYTKAQLTGLLFQNRRSWRLADHTTSADFISFLIKHGDLRAYKFRSELYDLEITRYSWGKPSTLELALSLKPRAYLCYATAVTVHGLAKLSPKTIYLNVEQSPKTSSRLLTQEGINRAFSGKQRQSNLIYSHKNFSVTIIAGKNTGRLSVEARNAAAASNTVQVTSLERTLIDIVVRPAYVGDASLLLTVYRAAKNRVSIERLLAILRQLDYVYPYHQAIGFLMQRAGYPQESWTIFRALGVSYDFYLVHHIEQAEYSAEWRLFYPKELDSH